MQSVSRVAAARGCFESQSNLRVPRILSEWPGVAKAYPSRNSTESRAEVVVSNSGVRMVDARDSVRREGRA